MTQEHHEEVVGDVVIVGYTLLFLREVMGERCFEISRTRGKDDLVAIDRFAFDH